VLMWVIRLPSGVKMVLCNIKNYEKDNRIIYYFNNIEWLFHLCERNR
jgi:hypothetical protein